MYLYYLSWLIANKPRLNPFKPQQFSNSPSPGPKITPSKIPRLPTLQRRCPLGVAAGGRGPRSHWPAAGPVGGARPSVAEASRAPGALLRASSPRAFVWCAQRDRDPICWIPNREWRQFSADVSNFGCFLWESDGAHDRDECVSVRGWFRWKGYKFGVF